MKVKVIVEQIISQKFEVEVTDEGKAYDEIREMIKNESIILNDPQLTQMNVMIILPNETEDICDWVDLHLSGEDLIHT